MLSLAFAGPVPTETGKIALSFTHAIHVVSSWGVLFWSCGPCLSDMGRFEFFMGRFAAVPGGAVSSLPARHQIAHSCGISFVRIPVYDSPCILTERAALLIQDAK